MKISTSYITPKGYRRVLVWTAERGWHQRMEHDLVWERHHGAIPEGYDVHHQDEDKLHNDIGNLELVLHSEHKLMHAGFVRKDGRWVRACAGCGQETDRAGMRKRRCRLCYNAHCRQYRKASGISTMRQGSAVVYVNHGPGWQSSRQVAA